MAEGPTFLSRWSSRKTEARATRQSAEETNLPEGAEPAAAPTVAAVAAKPGGTATTSDTKPALTDPAPARPVRLAPTMDEVAGLSPTSDFSRFATREVAPEVRNAAMRKLFADPHFNVMDGLDVYIDDYSKGELIPKAMLRQMVQARSLGLLDDELVDQDKPEPEVLAQVAARSDTPGSAPEGPVQLGSPDIPTQSQIPDEDIALQLQPDHAAGHEGPGASLGPGGSRLAHTQPHGAVPPGGSAVSASGQDG